ncbi:MAG: DUF2304 domain-containing protein [Deltaproteobacteria bacterium]|nr:DUF2304 domain-containing protein [Deltaproteobacteria bacterium]
MTPHQKFFALLAGASLFTLILSLVYRRRLREEYSWLWLAAGFGLIVVVLWRGMLEALTHLIGAVLPTTTLFIISILFLVLINIHFSTKISALTDQVRILAQQLALLREEQQSAREPGEAAEEEPPAPGGALS